MRKCISLNYVINYFIRKYVLINGRYVLKVSVHEGRGIGANDIAFNGKQVSNHCDINQGLSLVFSENGLVLIWD